MSEQVTTVDAEKTDAILYRVSQHPRTAQLKRVLRGVVENDPTLDPLLQYERAVVIESHLLHAN